jgi:hypothetical protein
VIVFVGISRIVALDLSHELLGRAGAFRRTGTKDKVHSDRTVLFSSVVSRICRDIQRANIRTMLVNCTFFAVPVICGSKITRTHIARVVFHVGSTVGLLKLYSTQCGCQTVLSSYLVLPRFVKACYPIHFQNYSCSAQRAKTI